MFYIIRRLSILILLLLVSFQAHGNKTCEDGLHLFGNTYVQVLLLDVQEREIEVISTSCSDNEASYLLKKNEVELWDVLIKKNSLGIGFRYNFQVAGDYHIGSRFLLKDDSVSILDQANTTFSSWSKTKYYPYIWDANTTRSVSQPDLILPGFKTTEGMYVINKHSNLQEFIFNETSSGIEIISLRTREDNREGYDQWETLFSIPANKSISHTFLYGSDLNKIQDLRFGKNDSENIVNPNMTSYGFKAWKGCDDSKEQQAICYSQENLENYTKFGQAMWRGNNYIIVRTPQPRKDVADAVKLGKATPVYYMYMWAFGTSDNTTLSQMKPEWFLRDSNDVLYHFPRGSNGNGRWQMWDIRNKDFRKFYISKAVDAINNGYKWIYLDGWLFITADDWYVGGDSDINGISWHRSRVLLLQELRDAIKKIDTNAILGATANRYLDGFHILDFAIREGNAVHWDSRKGFSNFNDFHTRKQTYFDSEFASMRWYLDFVKPYVTSSLLLSCKWPNTLFTNSCREGLQENDGYYYDNGDWFLDQNPDSTRIIWDTFRYTSAHIQDIIYSWSWKTPYLYGYNQSVFSVDNQVRVNLSEPLPIFNFNNKAVFPGKRSTLKLNPGISYIIADRYDQVTGWYWTWYGFAYYSDDIYIYGDYDQTRPVRFMLNDTVWPQDIFLYPQTYSDNVEVSMYYPQPERIINILDDKNPLDFQIDKNIVKFTLQDSGERRIRFVIQ